MLIMIKFVLSINGKFNIYTTQVEVYNVHITTSSNQKIRQVRLRHFYFVKN